MSRRPRTISFVGAGAVARSLGLALASAGYTVESVVSSFRHEAGRLAIVLGATRSSDRLSELPDSDAVFLCVPDDAIGPVASELAATRADWSGRLVAHTSGSRVAMTMEGLARAGALVCSFHPLQAFPHNGAEKSFGGIYIGIEGPDEAVDVASAMATSIGSIPVRVPTEKKPQYHLAAAVASNFLATLLAIANELLDANGRTEDPTTPGAHIFVPLVHETLANILATSPEAALTGPIARGDIGTVRMHVEALKARGEHLLPVYAAMAAETVRVAVRGGHIPADTANALLDVIAEATLDVGE